MSNQRRSSAQRQVQANADTEIYYYWLLMCWADSVGAIAALSLSYILIAYPAHLAVREHFKDLVFDLLQLSVVLSAHDHLRVQCKRKPCKQEFE